MLDGLSDRIGLCFVARRSGRGTGGSHARRLRRAGGVGARDAGMRRGGRGTGRLGCLGRSGFLVCGCFAALLGVGRGLVVLPGTGTGTSSSASTDSRAGRLRAGGWRGCGLDDCRALGGVLDGVVPLFGVTGGRGLEVQLGVGVKGVADLAAGDVLALDAELDAVERAENAVWQEQRQFGGGVATEVVVVFELMQVARRGHDIVAGAEAFDDGTGFALQRSFDQGLGRAVVLVREGDVTEGPRRSIRVDEGLVVAGDEVDPFKIRGDALGGTQHVGVHGALTLQLAVRERDKLLHGALDSLHHMGLELLEVVLHRDDVLAVVVLLNDLFVEAVVDASAQNIGVMVLVDLVSGGRVEGRALLSEKLDVLLSDASRFVDGLCALGGARL